MALPVLVNDSIQNYLLQISQYPVLSPEQEQTVAERYFREKKLEDAHRLVTANLRYVVKIALEFRNYGCRLADLIQEGNIGLMVAVKKFNPFKGYRLITYATWWIKSFIQEYIIKTKGIVKRGAKSLKKQLFYKNGGVDSSVGPEFEPSDELFANDLSLNAPIGDESSTHLDFLSDARPGQEEAIELKQNETIVKKEVAAALSKLNEKERLVIEQRIMSEEPESLQGLGDKLGLTRERVRQIESSALKKLQKTLALKEALPA